MNAKRSLGNRSKTPEKVRNHNARRVKKSVSVILMAAVRYRVDQARTTVDVEHHVVVLAGSPQPVVAAIVVVTHYDVVVFVHRRE